MMLLPFLLCLVSAEEAMQTAALEALEMCRRGADRDNVIGGVWRGERRETWRENAANSNTACGFQMCQFPVEMQRRD